MKTATFQHHRPKTVDEAVALAAEVAPKDGRILAGVDRCTGYPKIREGGVPPRRRRPPHADLRE